MAGTIGVYWEHWTLRELVPAYEAHISAQWDVASAQLCQLANIHRDPKTTPAYEPDFFHPYHQATGPNTRTPLTTENVKDLKGFFNA